MPRYFFDINNGRTVEVDQTGVVLANLEAASVQAHTTLAEMARDATPSVGTTSMLSILVRNSAGNIVLRAALSILIEQMPGPLRTSSRAI